METVSSLQARSEGTLTDKMQTAKQKGPNVGRIERWASVLGGGALALYGVKQRSPEGIAMALLGGTLVFRGASGHCPVYSATGRSTAGNDRWGAIGLKVEKRILINRPAETLYHFWRDFENLPRFMRHVESVQVLDDTRSHWVVKAPLGRTVEWDAEIINDRENEIIAWRSLPGADVQSVGSVSFFQAPGGRGTEVRVSLQYDPPAGTVGVTLAKLFGEEPEGQIQDDLRRFKQLMEAGEIATTEGQPQGGAGKKREMVHVG